MLRKSHLPIRIGFRENVPAIRFLYSRQKIYLRYKSFFLYFSLPSLPPPLSYFAAMIIYLFIRRNTKT